PLWHVRRDMDISNAPQQPVVFCGIARPERFLDQLRAHGVNPAAKKFYRDHHPYSDADVTALLRLKSQEKADGFITTEKDEVNLGVKLERLQPMAVARVTMGITNPADALDTLLRAISNRKP